MNVFAQLTQILGDNNESQEDVLNAFCEHLKANLELLIDDYAVWLVNNR